MRITIIVHDADEAPISFNLAGRSHDELDQMQDDVLGRLADLFAEARRALDGQDMEAARAFWAANGTMTAGVGHSGIRSAGCVKNGVLS